MARRLALAVVAAGAVASTALAASGDRERRAINAADQAWAKRINLTLRDLPSGFARSRYKPSGRTDSTCAGYSPDLSRFTITGEASSPSFVRRDGTAVFSSAEIFRSVSDQRADWAVTTRPAALACLRRALAEAGGGATSATVAKLPAPAIGERSIFVRVSMVVAAQGAKPALYMDLIGVARGRGDATLGVVSLHKPPSAALERSLLATLDSRLRR